MTKPFRKPTFQKTQAAQKTQSECVREAKQIREHLSEKQIDKMIADSFPASDPPSSY